MFLAYMSKQDKIHTNMINIVAAIGEGISNSKELQLAQNCSGQTYQCPFQQIKPMIPYPSYTHLLAGH